MNVVDTAAELTRASQEERRARERRDELIRQRRAEGASFRQIAQEAGMHHRSTQRIAAQ